MRIFEGIKNNPKAKEAYKEIINFNNELDKLLNKTFPAILFMVVYLAEAHIYGAFISSAFPFMLSSNKSFN